VGVPKTHQATSRQHTLAHFLTTQCKTTAANEQRRLTIHIQRRITRGENVAILYIQFWPVVISKELFPSHVSHIFKFPMLDAVTTLLPLRLIAIALIRVACALIVQSRTLVSTCHAVSRPSLEPDTSFCVSPMNAKQHMATVSFRSQRRAHNTASQI
jgi:hypothetical protein